MNSKREQRDNEREQRAALAGKSICPKCGKANAIVNQCRCDPNNLPTKPTPCHMTGTKAIESMSGITDRLDNLMSELRRECIAISSQWKKLGEIGGQRDDHAASLLASVRVHLQAIEHTAGTMVEQIENIEADPFGDGK